jgi:hypothetical protein
LLAARQALADRMQEVATDAVVDVGAAIGREADRGQDRARIGARSERRQRIAATARLHPRLERRRRAAEHDRHATSPRAPDREVARVIAHPVLLAERIVVLLVDDDQAEPRQRNEHAEARREHEVGVARGGGVPVRASLTRGKPAVQRDAPRGAQGFRDALRELRRQVDLGNEDQHLRAARDASLRGREIDVGLPAAGHAVQQRDAETCRLRIERRERRGLRRVESSNAFVLDGARVGCRIVVHATGAHERRQEQRVRESRGRLVVACHEIGEREHLVGQAANIGERLDRLRRMRRIARHVGVHDHPDAAAVAEPRANDITAGHVEAAGHPIVEELPRRDRHGDLRDTHFTISGASLSIADCRSND